MPVTNLLRPTPSFLGQLLLRLASATVLTAMFSPHRATAADNSWTNGVGTFVWNVGDANWTTPSVWNNDPFNADSAVFGPTGVGTVNLTGTINARSLNFTVDGYALGGGTLNLVNSGSGTLGTGTINVGGTNSTPTSTTALINSNLTSATGLIKIGDGVLALGGSGDSVAGLIALGNGSGSTYGANILIGSATSTSFGGTLRLTSPNALPISTTVAIGNGILDIGSNNVTLGGLTFTTTRPNGAYVQDQQGVIGTGTLTVTGPIRVIGNGDGRGNYVNVPVNANSSTLRLEVGSSDNDRDLMFLQPIGNGSVFKTFGVTPTGTPSAGGFALLGNNTYTGPTTINGGLDVIGGTNASSDLRVVNATVTILGASGSYESASAVRVVSGSLMLSNVRNLGGGNTPTVLAGNRDNRIGTTAAVTLDSATFILEGSNGAPFNQTVASLSVSIGSTFIELRAGTGQSTSLSVTGNLTVGTGASLLIGGAGLQTTAAVSPGPIRLVVNGSLPAVVNGVIPGLYGTDIATTGFVRNSLTPGVGLVMLAPGDYSTNTFGTNLNVDLTTPQTLTSSQSANWLRTSVNVTINGGNTLTIGAGGILVVNSVAFAGPGTLAFGNSPGRIYANAATTFSGPITGTGGLVRSGIGSVTLSGNLSGLSGGITTNGFDATLTLNTATYTGPINVVGGTLAIATNIGSGGPITLGAANTPAGTVGQFAVLNINTAAISNFVRDIATVGGDGTSPFVGLQGLQLRNLSTAAQTISGNISLGTHLTIDAGGTATTILSGQITGSGGLNILSGVVALTNASNNFQGGLQLNGGITAATSDAAFGAGTVRLLSGTLRTDYGGTFNRGLTVLTTGTFNTNGNNVTITGAVGGENPAATLTKAGAGILSLTGTNTYPGSTVVNGGALTIGAGGSLGSVGSVVTVNLGGILGGSGTVNGTIMVNAGGGVRGGIQGGTGTLTVTGNATLNVTTSNAGQITIEVAGPAASSAASRLTVNGVLNLAGLAPGIPIASDPKLAITLISNPANPLVVGETYSVLLAQTAQPGKIQRNGSSLAAGTVINPNDYTLISSDFGSFSNVQLAVNGAGSGLVLTFTPVPEPTTILGLAVAVLGLAGLALRAGCKVRSVRRAFGSN